MFEKAIVTLHRNCPVCKSKEGNLLYKQQFFTLNNSILDNEQKIIECIICGFIFSDSKSTKTDYNNYYKSLGKYPLKTRFSNKELEHAKTQVNFIEKNFAKDIDILEIGGGSGCLMYQLYQAGYRKLHGVSPNYSENQASEFFETKFGHFGNIPYKDKKNFDLVILSHVMEHVYDFDEMLHDLKSLIKEGGFLYNETPDASRYHQLIAAPFQDFNLEHINHFTPESIKNFLEHYGFEKSSIIQSELEIGSGKFMPILTALFEQTQKALIKVDNSSEIKKYIEKSSLVMETIKSNLHESLKFENKLIVWGVGQLFFKLMANGAIERDKIFAITDSKFAKAETDKKTNLELLPTEFIENFSYPIVVTSTIAEKAIERALQAKNIRNKIINLETHE